jgi:hypothetical protein
MNNYPSYNQSNRPNNPTNDLENPLIDDHPYMRRNTPHPRAELGSNWANRHQTANALYGDQIAAPFQISNHHDNPHQAHFNHQGHLMNTNYPNLSSEVGQPRAQAIDPNIYPRLHENHPSIFSLHQPTQPLPNPPNQYRVHRQIPTGANNPDIPLQSIYMKCAYCGYYGLTNAQQERDKNLLLIIAVVVVLSFTFLPLALTLCCLVPRLEANKVLSHYCSRCGKKITASPINLG